QSPARGRRRPTITADTCVPSAGQDRSHSVIGLAGCCANGSPAMRCGSMASSSQPGGAEQPVLVSLLRWSSPAQVVLPAGLRSPRRCVPWGGIDRVGGRVVLVEAEPAGVDVAAGLQSASQLGRGTGPGSRQPQRQPYGASEASPGKRP